VKPKLKPLIKISALLALLVCPAVGQSRQSPSLDCHIQEISTTNRSATITCSAANLPTGKTRLQFVDQFAGVDQLSDRVYALKVSTSTNPGLPLELRGNGLVFFTANSGAATIRYEMRLARAFDPAQHALVSSIGPDAAVLMMADLLPRICFEAEPCETTNPTTLKIYAPNDWQIATTERQQNGVYALADNSKAMFFLARFRERTANVGNMNLRIAVAGQWNFRDEDIFRLAEAIAREQAAMIASREQGEFLVLLTPFPQPLTGLRSSAVTLGRTVVLLLNPNNDSVQTVKHFRRHLAHEMFHFYLPNAFRIRENFDWFWEGFTRYVALMTLARLNLLTLDEYLDAISGEYEAYLFNPQRGQLSLIAASPDKFSSLASYDLVYRKGMLVAALYDLELRWQSRARLNLSNVMKALYVAYATSEQAVGNQEVLNELGKLGDFATLIRNDLEGTKEIDLAERLKTYGLKIEQSAATRGRQRLRAAAKLNERQKALLSSLANF